ncbi:MAG: hypothetical protein GWO04_27690, partial [Actinobacteria bacterium]|nr:hypothetical protein [Actinomycetota bacterium]
TVRAPTTPGEYRQAFNLVEEGVGFFADVGVAPPDMELVVTVTDGSHPGGEGGDPAVDPGTDPSGELPAGRRTGGGVVGGCSATTTPDATSLAPLLL